MSTHVYHPDLPGYDARNVLHDGCPECDSRSRAGLAGVTQLDAEGVRLLWDRMLIIKVGTEGYFDTSFVSENDLRLIQELYLMYVVWERNFAPGPRDAQAKGQAS